MTSIGLFEAKTRFSEICERVAASRAAVVVTRRGKPLVRIEPVGKDKNKLCSVWERRARYEKKHGRLTEDLELQAKERQVWRNPFDD